MPCVMESTLAKWGNSQGFRVPKEACEMLGVQPGSPATIEVDAERARLVVTFVQEQGPYHRTRRASAADVLAGFDGAYEPPSDWPVSGNEVDWGKATGKEAW